MKKEDFRIREDLTVEYLLVKKYSIFFKKQKWIEYPYWSKFETKKDAQKAILSEVDKYNKNGIIFEMPSLKEKNCHGSLMSMTSFSLVTAYNKETYYKRNVYNVRCAYCNKTETIVS